MHLEVAQHVEPEQDIRAGLSQEAAQRFESDKAGNASSRQGF